MDGYRGEAREMSRERWGPRYRAYDDAWRVLREALRVQYGIMVSGLDTYSASFKTRWDEMGPTCLGYYCVCGM